MAEQSFKLAAVMTLPRVSWTDSWQVIVDALTRYGIPILTRSGAFWGHGINELIQKRVLDGCDWVLTIDYDSMFTGQHLERLFGRLGANPQIDALAAYQCRRGGDETPLIGMNGEKQIDIDANQPLQVTTAHFGLTLLRCDALRKLSKPWFHQVPDSNGDWSGMDRTDPDIWFWRRWTEAGFTAYVDPTCRIGHLQLFVSEFDEDFKPRHVHVEAWREANYKQ